MSRLVFNEEWQAWVPPGWEAQGEALLLVDGRSEVLMKRQEYPEWRREELARKYWQPIEEYYEEDDQDE